MADIVRITALRCRALLGSAALVACVLAVPSTPAQAGCNSGNVPNDWLLSESACQAIANAAGSTAVGAGAMATGSGGSVTAFGYRAFAQGTFSTAVGAFSGPDASIAGVTAIGAAAGRGAAGRYSTAVGSGPGEGNTKAAGDYGIAIGGGDSEFLFDKLLVGARANRFLSIGIGTTSVADSDFAIALGFNARSGDGADIIGPIAIGPDALATLTNAVALGRFSAATAEDSTAVGSASAASGVGSAVLGVGAKATKRNAVALGSRSVANVVNTVSVGRAGAERRIMNVAPGLLNTDAVNLAQVKALVSAAVAQAQGTTQAVSIAPTVSLTSARNGEDAIRHELIELRTLVRQQQAMLEQQRALMDQQQQRITRLEGSRATAR